jgi:hypothetical protein
MHAVRSKSTAAYSVFNVFERYTCVKIVISSYLLALCCPALASISQCMPSGIDGAIRQAPIVAPFLRSANQVAYWKRRMNKALLITSRSAVHYLPDWASLKFNDHP